jgi:pilus assembly protein CpaE
MGSHDLLSDNLKGAALRNHSRILVIASPGQLETLADPSAEDLFPGLSLAPHRPGETVPDRLFAEVSLAVIEVDPYDRASVERIGAIREKHRDLPLIAAINGANVSLVRTLVREGVNDVVALPFDLSELLQASLDAVARRETAPAEKVELGPLITVARSIGGCGATSVATHLAAALAEHDTSGRGAIVVDLDLQFGTVADYLGVRPRGSIADLLGTQERLDEDLLASVTAKTASGISVLAAPDAILPLESVETDDLLRVIALLRRQYGYVVLDLPANWTNWTLSASLGADAIVLVVELSLPSLRQAKRRLELFRSVGIDDRAVEIVVNRVEKRLFRTIDLGDVEQTLKHQVLGSIALDAPGVATAQNQGMLVGEIHRKSKFVTDVARIAELVRDKHGPRQQ